jgi:hypothetical protein
MFTWLNKQGVQSDVGFVVQRTGRFTCEYREGGRILELEVESGMIGQQPCINIKRDAFASWNVAGVKHDIPEEHQLRMLQNFKDAMEFQGLLVVVD